MRSGNAADATQELVHLGNQGGLDDLTHLLLLAQAGTN